MAVWVGETTDHGETYRAFDPAAIEVAPGTTVSWEWTGNAPHNVAFQEADVEPIDIYSEEGVHFEHTFEEPGVYRYACEPHRGIGQKGAIVVE